MVRDLDHKLTFILYFSCARPWHKHFTWGWLIQSLQQSPFSRCGNKEAPSSLWLCYQSISYSLVSRLWQAHPLCNSRMRKDASRMQLSRVHVCQQPSQSSTLPVTACGSSPSVILPGTEMFHFWNKTRYLLPSTIPPIAFSTLAMAMTQVQYIHWGWCGKPLDST